MPTTLTDATFDEEIAGSSEPVLVDFWAEWCGPCKMIAPILDEISEEQAGKLKIAKLNVDDNPDIARRFDVMSIPTLIVFQDGQPAKRMVGAKGKGQLLAGAQRVPRLTVEAGVEGARPNLDLPVRRSCAAQRFSTTFHTGCGERQPRVDAPNPRRPLDGPRRRAASFRCTQASVARAAASVIAR